MREIYKVTASQIVVSDAHPEGTLTTVTDFPKTFDSRNYAALDGNPNGDADKALRVAKAAYHDQQSKFEASDSRAGWILTLERGSDGRQIMRDSWGAFPDMTPPEPQPQPEPEPEEPVETE